MKNYRYLIIGNSAGGIGAVEAIREIDKDDTIGIVSDEKHHVYGRPLISYYLANEISFDKIFYRPLDFYKKKNIDTILGKKVIKVDFHEHFLTLSDGEQIGFEKLLLATGGEPFIPPIKGLGDYEFFNFITLDDSIKIRDIIASRDIGTAVVLGGGLIGLKAAEALVVRGISVKVIELADRVLSPVLDEQSSAIIQRVMEEKGVEVITKSTIAEVVGNNGRLSGVVLNNGGKIDCQLLVVAIGVRPRIELVKNTVIQLNRGIVVDKKMRTNIPDVYACGDCAEVYDFIADNFRLTPLWPTAYVGGRVAGFNMAGVEKEYVWGTGMNAVDFFGFPVISAGIVSPKEDEGLEILAKLDLGRKIYKKFVIRDNNVVGMIFLNEVDRAGVVLALMRNKTDITSFKDDLLREDFGPVHLPYELRREINLVTV